MKILFKNKYDSSLDMMVLYPLQLSVKLNEEDDHGILPLDLALKSKQEDLARNLVEHNVNIDQVDSNGSSLLHLAIDRGESSVENCHLLEITNCFFSPQMIRFPLCFYWITEPKLMANGVLIATRLYI